MAENDRSQRPAAPPRPTIALPSRSSVESLFTGGAGTSPGPMTLVNNFFSENDPESDCRSFSQLLAGAMASPVSVAGMRPNFFTDNSTQESSKQKDSGDGGEKDFCLKPQRPLNLVIAQSPLPMFTIPPGLSPATLLDSPGFFSPGQGPFGMSHQQALAQVTAQAAQSQSYMPIQGEYPSSVLVPPTTSLVQHVPFSINGPSHQHIPPSTSDSKGTIVESSEFSNSEQRSQPASSAVEKPADDGYNWRKYGQKQVKGSEFPRSYYKCTHSNCPVKKKVERSPDGQVTEIIYKGQHNHPQPQPNKRAKESGNSNASLSLQGKPEFGSRVQSGNLNGPNENITSSSLYRKEQESSQATPEQLSGSSDGEEVGDAETRVDEGDDDEPDSKRRHIEAKVSEPASSHRTVTEPRIIVQTTSEVDLLDDGYRWRKYGQKVVKGNPYPRSYYKCTNAGCNVRKHVERASTDPKAVITTYEGLSEC
ncbi:PREDICTED: probable WRKY transcription factor 3 isoform X2 [Nelumbo nucifera]|uniref:Probable WRKY transcription factor 3 isoform X2 n=1 Tax=Nelumbo nucifera TaxID=4432 RepID=A0A1U8Q3R1_NELNU|nr:PREDICTED: probable WRKY transcription factor 3 isoform X2 [Nelumbo nucifera]